MPLFGRYRIKTGGIMKKLLLLLIFFIVCILSSFASPDDKVITTANFNEDWIVGTWKLTLINGPEAAQGVVLINSKEDNSQVLMTTQDGHEITMTLADLKQIFEDYIIPEEKLKVLKERGAIFTGTNRIFLNPSKTSVSYKFGITKNGQAIDAAITMIKSKK